MTLCELKTTSGEGFVKYLPVKHVSVKDMLRILKECKNNNQKALKPFIYTLIFWYMKGVPEVHIWAKFHLCLISSSQVFKFQMFSCQQKASFQAASGRFFGGNPQECGQICFKFWPPMQSKVMHDIFDSFYSVLKKWSKLDQKTDFLAYF